MAYCYNCGAKVLETDLFCANCGSRQCLEPQKTSKIKSTEYIQGVLLTDTISLSKKMCVSQSAVRTILEEYIEQIKKIGLEYSIVDVSSYTPLDPNISSSRGHITLNTRNNNWFDYSQLLADYYHFAYDNNKPEYLFIVGGNDTIPMPTIENKAHVSGEVRDASVDADLLYSYLLDRDTFESVMSSGEIFKYTPFLFIGRLPQGNNPSFDGFVNYFKRSAKVATNGGLDIKSAYGQTDTHWTVASDIVSNTISKNNLFPPEYDSLPDEYKYSGLLTTPNITIENIDKVFNFNANILYFNMHGSDKTSPIDSGYIGCDTNNSYFGISPIQIESLKKPNICISEACYGARYINFNTNQSMLLSALGNQTIAFLGSSRIAWGGSNDILYADVICKAFIDASFSGVPLGVALQVAKREYAATIEYLQPICETTLMEFNLFGDPSLMTSSRLNGASPLTKKIPSHRIYNNKPLITNNCITGYDIEVLYNKNRSILNYVRNKVDSTFIGIREKVNQQLYEQHGIEPRNLELAQKILYVDNNVEYIFYYKKSSGDVDITSIGITDNKGNIKNIIQSK